MSRGPSWTMALGATVIAAKASLSAAPWQVTAAGRPVAVEHLQLSQPSAPDGEATANH